MPMLSILAAVAAAAPSPATACSGEAYRAFDFWLGDWRVLDAKGAPDGSARIEAVPKGCAVLEYRTFKNGEVGTAINIFDPLSGQWRQLWSSPGTVVRLRGAPGAGPKIMEGTLATPKAERPLRVTWQTQADGSIRQNFFVKGDAAWKPLFNSLYVRASDHIDRALPAGAVSIPFDLQGKHIRLPATIKGHAVNVIVDTGLNPSGIAKTKALELGLSVGERSTVQIAGYGAGNVSASPATISGLQLGGVDFPDFQSLADDSPVYRAAPAGQEFDVILGSSFLETRPFLVDYEKGAFVILPTAAAAMPLTANCGSKLVTRLGGGSSTIPRIPRFRIGEKVGTALFDSGQGAGITILPSAMQPKIVAALATATTFNPTGARGSMSVKRFTLPMKAGTVGMAVDHPDAVAIEGKPPAGLDFAIVGNNFFKLAPAKVLLDYPAKRVTYFAACR